MKNNNPSQNELIYRHLSEGLSITPLQALKLYNVMRLSARIHNLRSKGHNIISKTVKYKGKHFSSYSLD